MDRNSRLIWLIKDGGLSSVMGGAWDSGDGI